MTTKGRNEGNGHTPTPLLNLRPSVPADDRASESLPNLLACLLPIWCDGKLLRKEGNLRIAADGSCWRVTLCCPTESMECSIEVESLLDLLDTLESLIRSGKANWRPDWKSRNKVARVKPVV